VRWQACAVSECRGVGALCSSEASGADARETDRCRRDIDDRSRLIREAVAPTPRHTCFSSGGGGVSYGGGTRRYTRSGHGDVAGRQDTRRLI